VVTADFRYLTNKDDRDPGRWVQESSREGLCHRLVWVVGTLGDLDSKVRELGRSRKMVERYGSRVSSLTREKQRQLFDEQGRLDDLEGQVKDAVARAFIEGELYFQGRRIDKAAHGSGFASLLQSVGESIMAELYSEVVPSN
jgi:hypothetical protein